jgi:hypothetical protein
MRQTGLGPWSGGSLVVERSARLREEVETQRADAMRRSRAGGATVHTLSL